MNPARFSLLIFPMLHRDGDVHPLRATRGETTLLHKSAVSLCTTKTGFVVVVDVGIVAQTGVIALL